MHARQSILHNVANAINTGAGLSVPPIWKSVYQSRVPPAHASYPLVLVYAESEVCEPSNLSADLKRSLGLVIEAQSLVNLNNFHQTEDQLNLMSADIERIVFRIGIGHLSTVEFDMVYDQEDKPSVGTVRLRYNVIYITEAGNPENVIGG